MSYNFYRRRIETAQAKRAAKGVDTSQVLSAQYAQLERPILVHAGPSPLLQFDGKPCEWPWAHMDSTLTERNDIIETGTFWPLFERFTVRVNLDLICTSYGGLSKPENPLESYQTFDLNLQANGYRYVVGSSSPLLIATANVNSEGRRLHIARVDNALKPALAAIARGYNIDAFDPDAQLISTDLRSWMLYMDEGDYELIQKVSFDINFDMSVGLDPFSVTKENPVFINIELLSDFDNITNWHESYNSGKPNEDYKKSKYCRVFCVGSTFNIIGVT